MSVFLRRTEKIKGINLFLKEMMAHGADAA